MTQAAIAQVRQDCCEALSGLERQLSQLKSDHVLITGGTGFVGSWLAEALACLNDDFQFGVKIYILARNTGRFQSAYPHLADRRDTTIIQADIRDFFDVPAKINWIIHAAATPDNRFHSSSPVETMNVIASGTMTLVKAVDRCVNIKKFLNISSGLAYGPQPWDLERIAEGYTGAPASGAVSSAYAEAKRFAETYCGAARSQQRLPIVTVRPFAFLGPYQSLETPWAINNFIRDALTGNVLRVLGDGQTVRSYMYGSDMAAWLLRILTDGAIGAAYNVGNPEGITLERLAQLVAERFNPRPEIRLNASNSDARHHRTIFIPDTTLATTSLGLSIKTPLPTALERTIQWNRAYHAGSAKVAA
ncbi:MAG TPA: NAD-dependent epimerase/dehydratase family protein [Elusimicrobiota bacterium]|nr:NAD-dependent epimerase/dehydratase family protein [Elusimicrobiota bacterium]